MRELDKIAENLFDKIRTRFENVNLGDENAKRTNDPTKARFFNFDYIDSDGKNYGNVTMSIVDDDGLKVYFSKNITDQLDDGQQEQWFEFLKNIRKFARGNLMKFDVRDINKSNLDIRDIKQQSKADGTFVDTDVTAAVTESRMWGTSRSSYQDMGPAKIIVRHSDNVSDEKRGDRSRKIDSVFVENHLGERRLLNTKNLHVARAMARHVSEGGNVDDELGCGIMEMGKEMGAMAHFVREAKRRQFEDAETDEMAKSAVERYGELKNKLKHLGGRRGYSSYKQDYVPAHEVEEEVDVDALRERFVKKIYDDRFTDALPYVYKAYKNRQDRIHTPMGEDFENWANEISEDAFETQDQEYAELEKIMATALRVGQDGVDARHALIRLFNDDGLDQELTKFSQEQGPDADARQLVLSWMKQNGMKIVASRIEAKLAQAQAPAQPTPGTQSPVPQQQPQQQVAAPGTDQQVQPPVAESKDPLDFMKRLAGLVR
jgi:hypothetical protein